MKKVILLNDKFKKKKIRPQLYQTKYYREHLRWAQLRSRPPKMFWNCDRTTWRSVMAAQAVALTIRWVTVCPHTSSWFLILKWQEMTTDCHHKLCQLLWAIGVFMAIENKGVVCFNEDFSAQLSWCFLFSLRMQAEWLILTHTLLFCMFGGFPEEAGRLCRWRPGTARWGERGRHHACRS